MSNKKVGFTITSSGNGQSYTGVGFQSNDIDFEVGPKGGSGSVIQDCSGGVDENLNQYVIDNNGNTVSTTSMKAEKLNNRCILVWEKISGTWTKIIEASFVSFDSDGFTIDVQTAHANAVNYQIIGKFRIV